MSRLMIISNLFPLPWEPGRGLFNAQQARALAEQHEVLVWVPVPWHQWWRQPHQQRQPVQLADNLRLVMFPFFYPPGLLRASYALCLLFSMLFSWHRVRSFQPQRILASWLYPDAVASVWLARRQGIPVVMKAHGSDVNIQCRHMLRRVQVRSAARRCQALYTVSQALAEQLGHHGIRAARQQTVYNGIDLARFSVRTQQAARARLGLAAGQALLVFVGNLKVSKGILDAVEAMSRLPATLDVHLCVLGQGPDRGLLEAAVARHGLCKRISLVGAQAHDCVPDWLAAADALLLPSHAEGVPNVVLEAMAMGRPVLASRVGGIPEVVPGFAGLLVAPHAPGELASAIEACLSRRWDSDAIRAHATQFSWEANARAVDALWQQEPAND